MMTRYYDEASTCTECKIEFPLFISFNAFLQYTRPKHRTIGCFYHPMSLNHQIRQWEINLAKRMHIQVDHEEYDRNAAWGGLAQSAEWIVQSNTGDLSKMTFLIVLVL